MLTGDRRSCSSHPYFQIPRLKNNISFPDLGDTVHVNYYHYFGGSVRKYRKRTITSVLRYFMNVLSSVLVLVFLISCVLNIAK